jgi:hypothetical protein
MMFIFIFACLHCNLSFASYMSQELKAERTAFRDAMQQTMILEATPESEKSSAIFGKKR